jgi:hypothetical protein
LKGSVASLGLIFIGTGNAGVEDATGINLLVHPNHGVFTEREKLSNLSNLSNL